MSVNDEATESRDVHLTSIRYTLYHVTAVNFCFNPPRHELIAVRRASERGEPRYAEPCFARTSMAATAGPLSCGPCYLIVLLFNYGSARLYLTRLYQLSHYDV